MPKASIYGFKYIFILSHLVFFPIGSCKIIFLFLIIIHYICFIINP